MAMEGDELGNVIKAAVDGLGGSTDRDAVFKAMGGAIVTYLKTHAVINQGITVQVSLSSGTGATTRPGTMS